jgi:hypothetical protein
VIGGLVPRASVDGLDLRAVTPLPASRVVERWNRAHSEHDVETLASLYAPTVLFYGTSLSRADCTFKKQLALKATPDYTQLTRDAKFEPARRRERLALRAAVIRN